jgi:hypothetical protein
VVFRWRRGKLHKSGPAAGRRAGGYGSAKIEQEAAVKSWMVISARRPQSADNHPIVLGRMKTIFLGIVAAVIVTAILSVLLIIGSVVAILVGILLVVGIGLAIVRAALWPPSRYRRP